MLSHVLPGQWPNVVVNTDGLLAQNKPAVSYFSEKGILKWPA